MTTTAPPGAIPTSVLRTVVPVVVGILITAALKAGITIPSGLATDAVTAGITALYYTVVRLLEVRVPAFGWLLGLAKSPAYSAAVGSAEADLVAMVERLTAGATGPVTLTVVPAVPASVQVVPVAGVPVVGVVPAP